jgi:hypothetical protein
MPVPYIPPTSSGLDAWSSNFSLLISANPATYGLTAADATAIATAVALYHAAYLLGGTLSGGHVPVNPMTRTPVTVADMRSQQGALVPMLRTYGSQIRIDPGVTNASKLALGLTLPNTTPSPVPAPTSNPVLSLVQQTHLIVQLSYKDSLAGTSKAKAPGAISMQLVGAAAAMPPVSPDVAPTIQMVTKSPFQISFITGQVGQVCNLWGRWLTRKGLVGPWSPMISMTIT